MITQDQRLPRTAWADLSSTCQAEILELFRLDGEVGKHPDRFAFERDARGRWGAAPADDCTALEMALSGGFRKFGFRKTS